MGDDSPKPSQGAAIPYRRFDHAGVCDSRGPISAFHKSSRHPDNGLASCGRHGTQQMWASVERLPHAICLHRVFITVASLSSDFQHMRGPDEQEMT